MITCVEIVFLLLAMLITKISLVNPLWDEYYLEFVINNYYKGPIVQMKLLPSDTSCDYYSMEDAENPQGDSDVYEIAG